MPTIENLEMCTGCFACYSICPVNAIEMTLENGFYKPKVNEKCINCGLCDKTCPILNKPEGKNPPICYAAWSNDEEIRLKSSSGGVFSEIARNIIERGGVVYGVAFDKDFSAKHIRVEKEEELELLRGSKYIPSFVGDAYKRVVEDLHAGKEVLFSGTPCQIVGLHNVLRTKKVKDDNLFTVEVVCHGMPSLTVFRMYLDYISKGRKIKRVNFRDKEFGWSKFNIKIEFENGETHKKTQFEDPFLRVFLLDLCLNKSCYDCPFSKIPRHADITLGDFWGVPEDLKDERGVSIVLINSEKGDKLLKEVENISKIQIPLEVVRKISKKYNPKVISGKLKLPKSREKILKATSFEEVIEILKREEKKIKIKFYLIRAPILIIKRILRKLKII